LADGHTRSGWQDGQTTDLFGRAHVPVSRLVPQALARRSAMNVTFGLTGFLSSRSADLQQSLESRLRRQLDGAGSTLFSLTWKKRFTPAGRPFFQHAASVLRTSETDCSSWPTPTAQENAGNLDRKEMRRQRAKAKHGSRTGNGFGLSLAEAAQNGYSEAGNTDSSRKTVALSFWATPAARDWKGAPKETYEARGGGKKGEALPAQVRFMLHGQTSNGLTAQTEKPGQLNPAHSRWLMGYPPEWDVCGVMAMQSRRKSQRNSSSQQERR